MKKTLALFVAPLILALGLPAGAAVADDGSDEPTAVIETEEVSSAETAETETASPAPAETNASETHEVPVPPRQKSPNRKTVPADTDRPSAGATERVAGPTVAFSKSVYRAGERATAEVCGFEGRAVVSILTEDGSGDATSSAGHAIGANGCLPGDMWIDVTATPVNGAMVRVVVTLSSGKRFEASAKIEAIPVALCADSTLTPVYERSTGMLTAEGAVWPGSAIFADVTLPDGRTINSGSVLRDGAFSLNQRVGDIDGNVKIAVRAQNCDAKTFVLVVKRDVRAASVVAVDRVTATDFALTSDAHKPGAVVTWTFRAPSIPNLTCTRTLTSLANGGGLATLLISPSRSMLGECFSNLRDVSFTVESDAAAGTASLPRFYGGRGNYALTGGLKGASWPDSTWAQTYPLNLHLGGHRVDETEIDGFNPYETVRVDLRVSGSIPCEEVAGDDSLARTLIEVEADATGRVVIPAHTVPNGYSTLLAAPGADESWSDAWTSGPVWEFTTCQGMDVVDDEGPLEPSPPVVDEPTLPVVEEPIPPALDSPSPTPDDPEVVVEEPPAPTKPTPKAPTAGIPNLGGASILWLAFGGLGLGAAAGLLMNRKVDE